jgi:tetratricopeptide (TPR) repeat protein
MGKHRCRVLATAAAMAMALACQPVLRASGGGVAVAQEQTVDAQVQTLSESGNRFFNGQQYDRAIAEYSKALDIAPKAYFALVNRGRAYSYLGRTSEAEKDLAEAVRIDPKGADALFHYGVLLFNKNNYSDAIETFDRLIEINPKYPDGIYYRGVCYSRKENYKDAMGDLIKAIELNPKSEFALFQLAFAQSRVGFMKSAVQAYTWAVQYKFPDPVVYLNRGQLCFQETYQFDQALTDLNTYIGLKPQDAAAHFLRAELLTSMGQDSRANSDWKKFESLGGKALPGYADRRRALFPNATFDPQKASEALQPGTATIVGQAFVKHRRIRIDATGTVVRLYPMTPYIEQWHAMRSKKESKNTSVFMSQEANQYGISVPVNEKGYFAFTSLKPGKYFLQTFFSSYITGTRPVYDGSDSRMVGDVYTTTNYYHDEKYRHDYLDRLESIVEVKKAGDSVKVTLRN